MLKKNRFPIGLAAIGSLVCLSLLSCSNTPDKGTVKGTLLNASGSKIYLEILSETDVIAQDSATPGKSGDFEMHFKTSEPSFYRLRAGENNFILLILQDKEQVSVEADVENFGGTAKIKGSTNSEKLAEGTRFLQENYFKMDSLGKVFQTAQESPDFERIKAKLEVDYNTLVAKESAYIINFISQNNQSLACLSFIDKLSPDEHLHIYELLDNGLMKSAPQNKFVQQFHQRMQDMKKTAVGSSAPDIVMNTPEGKTLKLSDYKGKVVLVDFWASWCRPCRAENPNVVAMYNKYNPLGFEVLSVSLDKDKDAWMKAIQDDKLIWKGHISDLGYWNSAVVKQYQISGIPFTCLVDRNGNIVAKGLRGEELDGKIRELLNTK